MSIQYLFDRINSSGGGGGGGGGDRKDKYIHLDIQPLFQKFLLDATTEFLLGESVNSLKAGDEQGKLPFEKAFNTGSFYTYIRALPGVPSWLVKPANFLNACDVVHDFVSAYVDRALKFRAEAASGDTAAEAASKKYVFLNELALETQDPIVLRDQIMSVLLAGRDGTAALLSWTLLCLTRHPRVMEKLRAEINTTLGGRIPTVEDLQEINYLKYVINEGIYGGTTSGCILGLLADQVYSAAPVSTRATQYTPSSKANVSPNRGRA